MTRMTSRAPLDASAGWTVVLPVKGGPGAKSRLGHPARADLAGAVALDTVAAVLACPRVSRVLVVTADGRVAADHAALGAIVVVDPGGGLAGALTAGANAARTVAGRTVAARIVADVEVVGWPGPCALLLADLPSLRPEDVSVVLDACERLLGAGARQVTVPDADGTGTVLLAAGSASALRPRFGPGSAAAHAAEALVVPGAPVRMRRDVDTAEHLADAVRLGVGPRTAAVLAATG